MSPCRLLEENGRAHFMTKRFDRDGNTKHHLQTLCGLAHLDYRQKATHDVGQLLLTIDRLQLGLPGHGGSIPAHRVQRDGGQLRRPYEERLVSAPRGWGMGAGSGVRRHARLSIPKGEWTYQHLMSVNGKFSDITREDLMTVADRFGIGTAPQVMRTGCRGGFVVAGLCQESHGARAGGQAHPQPPSTALRAGAAIPLGWGVFRMLAPASQMFRAEAPERVSGEVNPGR